MGVPETTSASEEIDRAACSEGAPPSRHRSRGGLFIAAGFGLTVLASLATTPPGGFWPLLIPAFLFAIFGLVRAKGWARRVAGVVVSGVSGGWMVGDLMTFLAGR
jgi:multisubunit Na+/H+ antiporter MnhB subunit